MTDNSQNSLSDLFDSEKVKQFAVDAVAELLRDSPGFGKSKSTEPANSVLLKVVSRLQHATMMDSSDPLDLLDALISQRDQAALERDLAQAQSASRGAEANAAHERRMAEARTSFNVNDAIRDNGDSRLDEVVNVLVCYLSGTIDNAGIPSQRLLRNTIESLTKARGGS